MEPTNPPVVNSNPLPTPSTPSIPPPPSQPAKKHAFLYVLSVLILVSSVGYATFNLMQRPASVASRADEIEIAPGYVAPKGATIVWTELLKNVPKNPDEVVATASANGETITLKSGEPADYDEVTFTWSGAKAVEPGTEIIGYYVYFGPNGTEIPYPEKGFKDSIDPKKEGVPVKLNSATFKKLGKGQTYYLYVQAVSNSKNKNPYYRYGLESLGGFKTLSAKKLFTYISK